jgi:hypothetical protein
MNSNNIKDTNIKDTTVNNNTGNIGSGQLLIQCGGYGNLQQIITLLERITHSDRLRAYFTNWKQQWYFAKSDDTEPPDNGDKLKTTFLKLFLDEVKRNSSKSKTRWLLDFVRLNIVAQRP